MNLGAFFCHFYEKTNSDARVLKGLQLLFGFSILNLQLSTLCVGADKVFLISKRHFNHEAEMSLVAARPFFHVWIQSYREIRFRCHFHHRETPNRTISDARSCQQRKGERWHVAFLFPIVTYNRTFLQHQLVSMRLGDRHCQTTREALFCFIY